MTSLDRLILKHLRRAAPTAAGRLKLQSERSLVIKARVDESAMRAAFVISTPSEDRQGEVVIPKGCLPTLSSYKANPVVHLNHKTDQHPIALSETYHGDPGVDVFEDRIEAVAAFHGKTDLSSQTWELTVLGVYKAASIGFRPILAERQAVEAGPEDYMAAEGDVDFSRKAYRLVFRRWELVEWSVTGVPCNQDAVVSADYRDLVTRTLSRGNLGGRPILPAIRADLAPLALAKRWHRVKGDSYFSDCERDDAGHCLPSGQAGSGGKEGEKPSGGSKPSGSGSTAQDDHEAAVEEWEARAEEYEAYQAEREQWEKDVETAHKEHAEAHEAWRKETTELREQYQEAHAAWEKEAAEVQDAYDAAYAAWEEETERLETEHEQAHDAWETRTSTREEQITELTATDQVAEITDDLQGGLDTLGAGIGANNFYSVRPDQREPYREALAGYAEGAPAELDRVLGAGGVLASQLASLGVTEEEYAAALPAVEKGKERLGKAVAKWQEALDAHLEVLDHQDAHAAKEPAEPDEEADPDAHAAWQKEQAAWQETADKLETEEADASSKVDEALEASDQVVADTLERVSGKVQSVAGKASKRLEKEQKADKEPEEPDLPDEPAEPDIPEEPEEPDYPDEPELELPDEPDPVDPPGDRPEEPEEPDEPEEEEDEPDDEPEEDDEKALPVAGAWWAAPRRKDSYFSECERDDAGHCLPSGEGGGGKDKPSGGKKPASRGGKKPDKARAEMNDAYASAFNDDPQAATEKEIRAAEADLQEDYGDEWHLIFDPEEESWQVMHDDEIEHEYGYGGHSRQNPRTGQWETGDDDYFEINDRKARQAQLPQPSDEVKEEVDYLSGLDPDEAKEVAGEINDRLEESGSDHLLGYHHLYGWMPVYWDEDRGENVGMAYDEETELWDESPARFTGGKTWAPRRRPLSVAGAWWSRPKGVMW